jgi:hypothetical protein
MKNKTVIFLHSPRSGGTTLNSILRYQYGIKSLHSFRNGFPTDGIESYLELSRSEQEKIKCFRGHINFGLHEYVPQDCTYITLVRHPIKRVLSLLGYISGKRGSNLLKPEFQYKLEKILNEGHPGYVPNDQVRRISGITRDKVSHLSTIETAKKNIDNYFAVVGITEYFDLSILLMEKLLNWKKKPWYVKNNYHGSGDILHQVSNPLIDKIQAQNQLDMEFYNYALNRFNECIKNTNIISYRELHRFQLLNEKIVSQVAPPILSLIRKFRKQ